MKTLIYNPSALEIDFAKAIIDLSVQLQEKLDQTKIINIENRITEDNPVIVFKLQNKEWDLHEVVLKVIQRIDH